MGRPKLTLSLGESTVLEHALTAVRSAGVSNILVVVAPDADDLAQLAENAHAHVLRLPEDTPDMRTTCQRGLDWIETNLHPAPTDGWLLLPADHPTLRPGVVSALLVAMQEKGRSIFVPTFQGKRGHPTWIAWSHVPGIRALPPQLGLNAYIRSHADEVREVEWPSDEILRDLDTPDDYARLLGDVTS